MGSVPENAVFVFGGQECPASTRAELAHAGSLPAIWELLLRGAGISHGISKNIQEMVPTFYNSSKLEAS